MRMARRWRALRSSLLFAAAAGLPAGLSGCGQLRQSTFPEVARATEPSLSPEQTKEAIDELSRAAARQQTEASGAPERR
jgi:hypothetical protein